MGRLLMLKECLRYNIVPPIIDESLKMFYYRGLSKWEEEQGYLQETCIAAQDSVKVWLKYFNLN